MTSLIRARIMRARIKGYIYDAYRCLIIREIWMSKKQPNLIDTILFLSSVTVFSYSAFARLPLRKNSKLELGAYMRTPA